MVDKWTCILNRQDGGGRLEDPMIQLEHLENCKNLKNMQLNFNDSQNNWSELRISIVGSATPSSRQRE